MNQSLNNSNEATPVAKEGHVVSEHMAKILKQIRELRRNHPEWDEPYSHEVWPPDRDDDDGPEPEPVLLSMKEQYKTQPEGGQQA